MAGEREEIAIHLRHVCRQVGHALRAIHHHARPRRVGRRANLRHIIHGAQHVGDPRHRHPLGPPRGQPLAESRDIQPPIRQQRDHPQRSIHCPRHLLPRHPVAMVLRRRNPNLVAGPDLPAGHPRRHQIECRRRAGGEHHFVRRPRADKLRHGQPRALIGCGGLGPQPVHAAPRVGVVPPIELRHRLEHGLRALRGRRVIQPRQLAIQNREMRPQGRRLERRLRYGS